MTSICICTEAYLKYYKVLYDSLKKHAPTNKQILYFIGNNVPTEFDEVVNIAEWFNNCNPNYNELTRICSLRARVILDAFDRGNEIVLFTGAKLEFFAAPFKMIDPLNVIQDPFNAVVTPHILEPLSQDGFIPSNASISFTGHISTDLVSFRDCTDIRKFLGWQDEIMKTKCITTAQTYLDQSWLNFLPFFVDNVKILRDPGYNIAYWNFKQRDFRKDFDGSWIVWNKNDDFGFYTKITCFQYSGLDLNNPKSISTHQNRYEAEGDFLQFLTDYAEKVK